jgi:voltage-gated potassium channel
MGSWQRLGIAGGLCLGLVCIGVTGYMLLEGWGFFDALYQTVTAITTAGFGEIHPMDTKGRAFTIAIIGLGVITILYVLSTIMHIVVEGELGQALGVRRMKSKIEALRNHYILCGFGRVGEEIGREFHDRGIPFVVVESNPEAVGRARERDFLLVEGDSSSDAILVEAGIERARCLLAASDSDAGNTYVTLTAKAVNPDILVVARAGQPVNQEKMRRAGADRVISPYLIGGRRMALSALQPLVVDFIDTLVEGGAPKEHIIAELEASEESGLAGHTLQDALEGCASVTVLAIQKPTGEIVVGPRGAAVLELGDRLIILGEEVDLEALSRPRPARV